MFSKKIETDVKERDLVLIHIDEQPAFFARVEGFTPDKKPNWWHVKFLILNIPVKIVTWILRLEQLNGEPFTMQGTPTKIERVNSPEEKEKAPLRVARAPSESSRKNVEKTQDASQDLPQRQARILSLGGKEREDL